MTWSLRGSAKQSFVGSTNFALAYLCKNGKAIQRHNIVPLYLCLLVYLIVPLTWWKTRGVKLKSLILVVNIHPYLYSGYNQIQHKLVLFSRPPSSTTPEPHSHPSRACPKPVPNHFTKMDAYRFYETLPSIIMLNDCFIIQYHRL